MLSEPYFEALYYKTGYKKKSQSKFWGERACCTPTGICHCHCFALPVYRPYAYDVTEGRPAALGVKRNIATCVIAKHTARGANPASHTAGLARPGPHTERLSANAHCQHNTCALRDTRLASLLWRCDPLWRQCIRSIVQAERSATPDCDMIWWINVRNLERVLFVPTFWNYWQFNFTVVMLFSRGLWFHYVYQWVE